MRWHAARAVPFILVPFILAGCNQVFGIEATGLAEGAAPDAPFACPLDPTSRPLRFSTILRVAYPQSCRQFSLAAAGDLAVAMCELPDLSQRVFEGTSTGELTESVGISYTYVSDSEVFHAPRLSPDANELYVRVDEYDVDQLRLLATRYDAYTRSGTGWASNGTLAFANEIGDSLGSLSLDPDGSVRGLLMRRTGLTEWVRRGGVWMLERTYPVAFPSYSVYSPMLSRDGLQFIAVGGPTSVDLAVLWGSRSSVDVAFTSLTTVPDLPVPTDQTLYLTENCGRAYFTGLENVFYAQQQ